MNTCPDCNSQLHRFREGRCLIVRCSSPACAWTVATTFPVPINRDYTRYSIIISELPDAPPAILMALNHLFTHGIATTRHLAIRGELPPFEGSALEIWHEAQRLLGVGVPFRIEPNYPFDLKAPETAFGPADEQLPEEIPPA